MTLNTQRTQKMDEIWKTTLRDEYIEVSSLGRARRKKRPLIYKDGRKGHLPDAYLKGCINKEGYVYINSGSKRYALHRLLAETFLEEPKEIFAYQTVNHKNGIKIDNRVENLEWNTVSENTKHAHKNGLSNISELNRQMSRDRLYKKGKNRFMINPYMVYSSNPRKFARASRHKEYLDIIKFSSADKLAGELTEYCNDIEKTFKEYVRKYGNW